MQFSDLNLDPRVQKNLRSIGFMHPTPIQEKTIPAALKGRDILGSAETGTGKTAAFLLPVFEWLLGDGTAHKPRVLVLVPTRELALQVADHGEQLARNTPIRIQTVFGGVGIKGQLNAFRRGVDVVIATPGRLLDVMRRGAVEFDWLDILVLDEADRMLDIGFLPDIRRIVKQLPERRQTMLFSATIEPVYFLAQEVTYDALRVDVETAKTPEAIDQAFFPVAEHRKPAVLEHLLSAPDVESALVFTRTKRRADSLVRSLRQAGLNAGVIHGDRTQEDRFKVLESFRRGRTRILVATDVAARGIDVTGISHVVNYDAPMKSDDYVHRIGRTGRAEASGIAWTLVSPRDEIMAERIERVVDKKIDRRPVEGIETGRPVLVRPPEKVATGNGWTRPSRRRRL